MRGNERGGRREAVRHPSSSPPTCRPSTSPFSLSIIVRPLEEEKEEGEEKEEKEGSIVYCFFAIVTLSHVVEEERKEGGGRPPSALHTTDSPPITVRERERERERKREEERGISLGKPSSAVRLAIIHSAEPLFKVRISLLKVLIQPRFEEN